METVCAKHPFSEDGVRISCGGTFEWTVLHQGKSLWGEKKTAWERRTSVGWMVGPCVVMRSFLQGEVVAAAFWLHSQLVSGRLPPYVLQFPYSHCSNALPVRKGCVAVPVKTAVAPDVLWSCDQESKEVSLDIANVQVRELPNKQTNHILLKYSQLLLIYFNIFLYPIAICLLI